MEFTEDFLDRAQPSPIRMSSSVHPVGAEKTAIGPTESVVLSSRMLFRILGIPLPSTSKRLPPNFATERDFFIAVSP